MSKQPAVPNPPQGITRFFARLPIWLYRAGLGWILGRRFLMLTHIGRKSGLPRQVVLEIADHDPETDTYTVASGFGAKSDWYQNIQKTPEVIVQVGNRRMQMMAEPLSADASGEAMVSYARRYPGAARNLVRIMGYQVDGTEQGYRQLGEQKLPFVQLRPRP